MSYKDIKPGKYKARAVRGGIGKAKTGTLQVAVEFELQMPDASLEKLWWIGFLTEKAKERTVKTLALLDFVEEYESSPNGEGSMFAPGALNTEKDVELVVELEPNPNKDNQMFPRIKWVNEIGGARFQGLPVNEIKSELAAINFAGELAAARAELGKPATRKPSAQGNNMGLGRPAEKTLDQMESELPF